MPKILSGKRRGALLSVPEGRDVRPTLARVREALFSMLTSHLGSFDGLNVLDPYAGSGALGLEAWSRGAAHVDFVESNREHFRLLMQNVVKVKAESECHCVLGSSPDAWKRLKPLRYDLVLCDPPYAYKDLEKVLQSLRDEERLQINALITLETDARAELILPAGFEEIKRRKYRHSMIVLLQYLGSDV